MLLVHAVNADTATVVGAVAGATALTRLVWWSRGALGFLGLAF